MITNLTNGHAEDNSQMELTEEDRNESIKLWKSRLLRIYYSLVNCAIWHKDFDLAVKNFRILVEMEDKNKKPVVLSAMGRLFLQLGKCFNYF